MQPLTWYFWSLHPPAAVCIPSMRCMSDVVWHGAVAEAGEQVLKQQQQLASLARQQRRQPLSSSDHSVIPHTHATTVTKEHTDISADKPKSADTATDSLADQVVYQVTSWFSLQWSLPELSVCLSVCCGAAMADQSSISSPPNRRSCL